MNHVLYTLKTYPARWLTLVIAVVNLLSVLELISLSALQIDAIVQVAAIVIVIAGLEETSKTTDNSSDYVYIPQPGEPRSYQRPHHPSLASNNPDLQPKKQH